jgi:hypothetical protein
LTAAACRWKRFLLTAEGYGALRSKPRLENEHYVKFAQLCGWRRHKEGDLASFSSKTTAASMPGELVIFACSPGGEL